MSEPSVTIVGGGERIPGSSGVRFQGKQIVNTHKVKWMVDGGAFVDTPTTDPRRIDSYSTRMKILYDNGGLLPLPGITVLTDGSICMGLEAERHEKNPRYWEVTAEFGENETKQKAPGGDNPNPNPTTWIPVWELDYKVEDFFDVVDARGLIYRNSLGKPFDGGLRRGKMIACWSFFQYEQDILTEDQVTARNEICNAFDFKGFKKHTLLLVVKGSARGIYNGYPARRIDYEIQWKKGKQGGFKVTTDAVTWTDAPATEFSGWRELTLDVSPFHLVDGDAKQYREKDGQPALANLNGAGQWAGKAGSGFQNPPALLAYEPFPLVNFSSFLRT